jgi:hypothetical protein
MGDKGRGAGYCTAGDFRVSENAVSFDQVGRVKDDPIRQQILRKEACHMAIESHLAELERRHSALEQQISEALAHPSIDNLQIAELKRRKLHVKDEIARLRQEAVVH